MTIDHYGKIIDTSLYLETNNIGRVTYPLLAWIIGIRLALDPESARRYIGNLFLWALITQPIFVYIGYQWVEPNIFFTLLAGVIAHYSFELLTRGAHLRGWIILMGSIVFSAYVPYGVFGVATIPIIAKLSTKRVTWGLWCLGPLGVLSNLILHPPYIGPGAIYALFASVIAALSLRVTPTIPRLPKQLFYAYYPGHLLVFYLIYKVSIGKIAL